MLTLYNKTKKGQVKQWSIILHSDRVETHWGLQDGKQQSVTEYGKEKNHGKANYISREEDAANIYTRKVLGKRREGYSETLDDSSVCPFELLPHQSRMYKPTNSLPATLRKKITSGGMIAVRKYDGECFIKQNAGDETIHMYSRTMLPHHHNEVGYLWNTRFNHIEEEMYLLPEGTIIAVEMVAPKCEESGLLRDDRWYVSQVIKSLTDRALELQLSRKIAAVVWDVPYFAGKCLKHLTYIERLEVFQAYMEDIGGFTHMHVAEYYELVGSYDDVDEGRYTLDMLEEVAKEYKMEGWVIRDPNFTHEMFSLTGKVVRPAGVAKFKPEFEDDFIAKWDPDNGEGTFGNGRYTGMLGSVKLYQLNDKGHEIFICKMGNGFTKEFIEENSTVDKWPKVLQVLYTSRTYTKHGDKTNALQFPRVPKCKNATFVRTDKSPDECINENL